ncbi:MAG: hypothetical protein RRY38_03005, partial [Oscillospiraceae bacterium]
DRTAALYFYRYNPLHHVHTCSDTSRPVRAIFAPSLPLPIRHSVQHFNTAGRIYMQMFFGKELYFDDKSEF